MMQNKRLIFTLVLVFIVCSKVVLAQDPGTPLVMLRDVSTVPTGVYQPEISRFVEMGGVLFFVMTDEIHGRELWRTDGTTGGTYLVKDIYPGSGSSRPELLGGDENRLFFSADDGPHGVELWGTDGTTQGTNLVHDLLQGWCLR